MNFDRRILRCLARAAALSAALLLSHSASHAAPATATPAALDNKGCLECHGAGKDEIKVTDAAGKKRALRGHDEAKLAKGVHAKMQCVDCHKNITDSKAQHKKAETGAPDCKGCHLELWAAAQRDGRQAEKPGLGAMARVIESKQKSVHAAKDKDDPSKINAPCAACHDAHSFVPLPKPGTPEHNAARLAIPAQCGTCHEDHLEEYSGSVHGKAVVDKKDPKAAICTDCHNVKGIDKSNTDAAKKGMVEACSGCHKDNAKSYKDTYHGQITTLGYTNTAMCFNCHGSHDLRSPKDPKSKVHPDNRLKTCQKCHKDATAGFATYEPHGNAHDFKRYPQIWLTTHFMVGLLLGTFAFFWIHVILWLYREIQDRKKGVARPVVEIGKLDIPAGKQFQRFGPWWRLGHLLFAVSLMILTLTGMTLMYAGSSWAPVVMQMLGGPKVAAIIHRVNAVIFTAIFLIHLVYIAIRLAKSWRTFKIFGPDSLVPGPQDLWDVIAMFKWFFGLGPRPVFDRWTYWEKFDYWAPFWGVSIVGFSGLVMWFPNFTASFLPGWVFNVAVITHGEEAFLAAVFLFTVHFFNNHFRPEKFPLDTVMFTGAMSLEHFARDHPLHYKRLAESGELHKYLVDAPSKPMQIGSKILGFTLIAFGLILLVLIGIGFFGSFGS
ncbi:MAG TPA: cytochrome C [Usitatibacteraceae bacterium]|nr:cytochrome C [Usitatibacteraceae bacterium]